MILSEVREAPGLFALAFFEVELVAKEHNG